MLQNEPLDVKKLVDTAENGPLQSPKSRVCGAGSASGGRCGPHIACLDPERTIRVRPGDRHAAFVLLLAAHLALVKRGRPVIREQSPTLT